MLVSIMRNLHYHVSSTLIHITALLKNVHICSRTSSESVWREVFSLVSSFRFVTNYNCYLLWSIRERICTGCDFVTGNPAWGRGRSFPSAWSSRWPPSRAGARDAFRSFQQLKVKNEQFNKFKQRIQTF